MEGKTKGIIYGVLASVLWGTIWPLSKVLTAHYEINPFYIAFLRFLIAGLTMLGFFIWKRDVKFIASFRQHWRSSILLGFFGMFGMGSLVFCSIKYTTTVNSSLLMNSNAIFIILFSLFIGEKITALKAAGTAAGLAGCYLIINNGFNISFFQSGTFMGDMMGVGAAVCWAAYTVIGRSKVRNADSSHLSAMNFLFGAIMISALVVFMKVPVGNAFKPVPLAIIVYIAILPTAYGFTIWYYALEHVEAGVLGLFQFIVPLIATVAGVIFFKERFTGFTFAGMALILTGVYFAGRNAGEKRPDA